MQRLIKTGMVQHARWKQDRFQSINRHTITRQSAYLHTRCVAFDQIAFRSSVASSKARSREMSNKRAALERRRGGKVRKQGDWKLKSRARTVVISNDEGWRGWKEGDEGEELNKCLPAEICVPIFETLEFPRTAKWHHTGLPFLLTLSTLHVVRFFSSFKHTHADRYTYIHICT